MLTFAAVGVFSSGRVLCEVVQAPASDCGGAFEAQLRLRKVSFVLRSLELTGDPSRWCKRKA